MKICFGYVHDFFGTTKHMERERERGPLIFFLKKNERKMQNKYTKGIIVISIFGGTIHITKIT